MEIQKDRGKKEEKEGGEERKRQRKQGKTREQTKRKVKVTHFIRLFFFPCFCGHLICKVSDSLQPRRL